MGAISTRDLAFWQRLVKLTDALARNIGFSEMHAAKFLQRCQMRNSCICHFRSPKINFLEPFKHDKMTKAFVRDEWHHQRFQIPVADIAGRDQQQLRWTTAEEVG